MSYIPFAVRPSSCPDCRAPSINSGQFRAGRLIVSRTAFNLLSALAPRPLFDLILSSPPKHAGEPRDLDDRGWHAGPNYRDTAALFDQSRERLRFRGRLYVMVSSDSDVDLFAALIDQAGFRARLVHERSILIESLIIYELLAH